MQSSTAKKIAIGYLIALPILLILGLMQSQVVTNFNRVQQEADEAAETLEEIEALLTALKVAAAASERGFSGGGPGIESSAEEAQAATRERLRHVRQLTEKYPQQRDRLNKLEALVEKGFESVEQEAAGMGGAKAAAESGKAPESMRGKVAEDVRKVTDEIRAEETSILRDRNALARLLADRASSFTTLWAILALWLIGLAALLLYRKSSEQKWAGFERRMKARILEALPVGVCLTDEHGIILYTNPAEDALLGYEQGELMGRFLANLESQPPEERDRLAEEIVNRLHAEGSWSGEFVAVRKNRATFKCHTRALAMEVSGKQFRLFLQETVSAQHSASRG